MTATLPDWIPFPEAFDQPAEMDRPAPSRPAGTDPVARSEAVDRLGDLRRAADLRRRSPGSGRSGFPNTKIFDEAYYPVEAQELLRFGYEDNRGYMFIVHPPLGSG